VPRVIIFLSWGPKLLQLQNLGGCFVDFFIGGQNRNFGKIRGLKLQLNQNLKSLTCTTAYLDCLQMNSTA